MSKTNKIFESIPVKIPDRSGFDLSHEVLTTAKPGTVVPITHFEVLPGDTISMGSLMKVTLPPFAVPFMGRIDAELTAAFIPNRLLWQGWQSFITGNNGVNVGTNVAPFRYGETGSLVPAGSNVSNVPLRVPCVDPFEQGLDGTGLNGPGSLLNYLGVKRLRGAGTNESYAISALPFLAYHKFCDDWIRDENTIKPFFPKAVNAYNIWDEQYMSGGGAAHCVHYLPYFAKNMFNGEASVFDTDSIKFPLGPEYTGQDESIYRNLPYNPTIGLGSLRQRCWAKDYFTTATTRPQAGADSQVLFDTSGETGGFTIATLRAANALQKWLERNNLGGTEYGSQILAHFGVMPPDSALNRSVLLGSVRTPVYVGSVENNNGDTQINTSYEGRNPYGNALGSAAGFGSSSGQGSLVDNFTAKEHGFIMVFFTLIPHAYYNTGIDRSLLHKYIGDFAFPEFSGIGDQPIFNVELSTEPSVAPTDVFGYQQRYVEYKHKLDMITGMLSEPDPSSGGAAGLSVYALQRGFAVTPQLGRDFLEIPTDYLDQVYGISADVAGFGCMVDAFFDARALRVLPEYSLPHL